MEHYEYHTARGKATLNRGDRKSLVALGQFETESAARACCENHYAKVRAFLLRMNKPVPQAFYL